MSFRISLGVIAYSETRLDFNITTNYFSSVSKLLNLDYGGSLEF